MNTQIIIPTCIRRRRRWWWGGCWYRIIRNNRIIIKWKIVFKNEISSEIKYELNNSSNSSNNNQVLEIKNISEHLINKLFPNIYIINGKNMYQFKCTEVSSAAAFDWLLNFEPYCYFEEILKKEIYGKWFWKN